MNPSNVANQNARWMVEATSPPLGLFALNIQHRAPSQACTAVMNEDLLAVKSGKSASARGEGMFSRQDYIENILDHHDNPRNKRKIEHADIEASGGNPGCGDIVVMYAKLGTDGRIIDAAFQGEGCTISQAAASMLTEELIGRSLDEVREMSFEDVIEEMGRDVVATRTRCATLALTIAKNASERLARQRELSAPPVSG